MSSEPRADRLPEPIERRLFEVLELDEGPRAEALEDLSAAHPEHAEQIRNVVRLSQVIGDQLDHSGAPPSRIGPYEILRRLGEGGMGVVYLARQTEPVERQVALKVTRPGLDGARVLSRFQVERQALARMDHPTIARALDVGMTPAGQPYYTMDYIEGLPITAYCEREGLSLRQRLELFREVCAGVQHAHQKGVLHRDLKPANILVATVDGVPAPRIIDFGLARAAEPDPSEQALLTHLGEVVGTPAYMSPEQAGVIEADVDTRTDIYSLGVLLFELLVGALPEAATTRSKDPADRMPTRPSAKRRALRGDLDWITLKAMEADPGRRYPTVQALAQDIELHLRHEPIVAGPPALGYRLHKFLRRYRWQSVAALAVLLSLAAGLAVSTSYYLESRRNQTVAQHSLDFLLNLFRSASPFESFNADVPVRALLDKGAARIEAELAAEPEARAELLSVLAHVQSWLHEPREGLDSLRKAIAARVGVAGPDDPEVVAWRAREAQFLRSLGQVDEAERVARDAVARARRLPAGEGSPLGICLCTQSMLLQQRGRYDAAQAALDEAVEVLRERGEHLQLAEALEVRAGFNLSLGRSEAALASIDEALRVIAGAEDPHHLRAWVLRLERSLALTQLGRHRDADRAAGAAIAILAARLGTTHPSYAMALVQRAEILQRVEGIRAALELRRRAVEILARYGETGALAWARNDLGVALLSIGQDAAAAEHLARACAFYERMEYGDHLHHAIALQNLARATRAGAQGRGALERIDAALGMFERLQLAAGSRYVLALGTKVEVLTALGEQEAALELCRRANELLAEQPGSHRALGVINLSRCFLHNLRGEAEAALAAADRAVAALRNAAAGDTPDLATALYNRGWAQATLGHKAEARRSFRAAIDLYEALFRAPEAFPPQAAFPLNHLGLMLVQDDPHAAVPHFERALQIRRAHLQPGDYWHTVSVFHLGVALQDCDEHARAEPLLREAHAALQRSRGADNATTRACVERLVRLYEATARQDQAAEWRARLGGK